MKLHIGCGTQRLPDFVNCDMYPGEPVDEVFNACDKWPFQDDAAELVYASHVLEHLPDPRAFFRECWRVLRDGGQVVLRVPYGSHRSAWWDLEHIRPWHAETFCFLQPGYGAAIGNPQHNEWTATFKVDVVQMRVTRAVARLLRTKLRRRLLARFLPWGAEWCEELHVHLTALKSKQTVREFSAFGQPNAVPIQYVAYRHHFIKHGQLAAGQPAELVPLAVTNAIGAFF